MKKFVWLWSGLVLFVLASCSNPQQVILTSQEDTLRNEVELKAGNIQWSNEIEPERLTAEINDKAQASAKEYITPQMLSSIKELQPAVYPELKDFASLDCSAMNDSLLSAMNSFCKELCNGTGLQRKLIDRHRRYIIAAAEILKGDFPLLGDYLSDHS